MNLCASPSVIPLYRMGLFGNVYRKAHSSIGSRDAIHNRSQGLHVPLLRRFSSTQEICKERETDQITQSVVSTKHKSICGIQWKLISSPAHPHHCSSAGTAPECCSIQGCYSRCCPNWAHWTTTPVCTNIHMQKLLSVTYKAKLHTKIQQGLQHSAIVCMFSKQAVLVSEVHI